MLGFIETNGGTYMMGSYADTGGYMYYYSCFPSNLGANGTYTAVYNPNTWMYFAISIGQANADASTNTVSTSLMFHSSLGNFYLENYNTPTCGAVS